MPSLILCPRCGAFMVPRQSRRGPFYGCSAFPRCRGTREPDGRVGWSTVQAEGQTERVRQDGEQPDDFVLVSENDPGPAPGMGEARPLTPPAEPLAAVPCAAPIAAAPGPSGSRRWWPWLALLLAVGLAGLLVVMALAG